MAESAVGDSVQVSVEGHPDTFSSTDPRRCPECGILYLARDGWRRDNGILSWCETVGCSRVGRMVELLS